MEARYGPRRATLPPCAQGRCDHPPAQGVTQPLPVSCNGHGIRLICYPVVQRALHLYLVCRLWPRISSLLCSDVSFSQVKFLEEKSKQLICDSAKQETAGCRSLRMAGLCPGLRGCGRGSATNRGGPRFRSTRWKSFLVPDVYWDVTWFSCEVNLFSWSGFISTLRQPKEDMEKHHRPHALTGIQARRPGAGDGGQSVRVICRRHAEVPGHIRWWCLGQEMAAGRKIKTTLTSDTELTDAIKCHVQGIAGSVQI